ncbi:MAG: bifunctional glutamate N-acetyltransferase/amino-acid acetyltransferase ArgJ [Candidatus Thermoplasmatota archaeon]
MQKNITDVNGFKVRGCHIGIKSKRRDLAIIVSDVPASAAAVYTKNRVQAHPIILTKEHLKDGRAQAILVTSGNANACNGPEGMEGAKKTSETLAEELGIPINDVIVAATGVIGEPFPTDKVLEGIRNNINVLSDRKIAGDMAANAIMTTDTFQKEHYLSFKIDGKKVNIAGIAKGSGMIHPNMGTMLCFIVSDVNIAPSLLQDALSESVEKTFNMISVDGDTSTNDMVSVLSNGLAENERITKKDEDYEKFKKNLEEICRFLAKAIVSDGEGATKFIEYHVVGAKSEKEARQVARTISNSNLVRTALFGRDPNWGRIIAAAGRSGVEVEPKKIDIHLGSNRKSMQVAEKGGGLDFDRKRLKLMLKSAQLRVLVDLNQGDHEATAWGCDFSYEYVRINAEYHT